MTRRSARIQEKQVVAHTQSETTTVNESKTDQPHLDGSRDDDQEESDEEEFKERSSRKRARNNSKKTRSGKDSTNEENQSAESSTKKLKRMPEEFRKVRGKLGMLERLAKDVPLDVIFEIFCYLDPSDLLHLARTSKDLRGILMSKSAESIWRISRENVEGLPPLPLDLNEPQYAHLLFESYCHVCNHKGRCDSVYWSFRMRCCKHCAAVTFPHVLDTEYWEIMLPIFRERAVLPEEHTQGSARRDRRHVGNLQIAKRFRVEYEALQTLEDRDAWITRRLKERRDIALHGALCEEWHKDRLKKRGDELDDIRKQRKNAILDRLAEIGWREEAEIISKQSPYGWDEFTTHKLVKQTKKLTEYGWNIIKHELVTFLSAHKIERLATERRRTLHERYSQLTNQISDIRSKTDLREPFPAIGDISTYKVFEDLIWDTPEDQKLTGAFFREKLLEHLPTIIEKWRPAKIQELIEIMRKSVPTAGEAELHLATSVFTCKMCYAANLHYPQMFYHPCCTRSPPDHVLAERKPYIIFGKGSWKSQHLTFSDNGSRVLKTLVEACSLDPATTTIQDMHSANPLIECTSCFNSPAMSYYDPGRAFMRWPYANSHMSSYGNHQLLIVNSSGEDLQQILACEKDARVEDGICCAHCHELTSSSVNSLLEHIKAVHSDIDVDALEAANSTSPVRMLRDSPFRDHWYCNPRVEVQSTTTRLFRYHKAEPAPVETAPQPTT